MNSNLTELVFILDRSGSMSGLESDTIGGFNSMLDRSGSMSGLESDTIGGFNSMLTRQREEPGDALVTTVLFDDRYELLHDRIPIKGVAEITRHDYYVRGTTALLDAIGRTISKIAFAHAHTSDELRPGKTMVIIITDGMENASREYRIDHIRRMIEQQKAQGWEFLFLGANIDAIGAASRMGIHADRAVQYHSDPEGTRLNYEVLSETVSCVRASRPMASDWKSRIDEDFQRRKK